MKIQSKEITEVGIDTLVPHPKNSHKHSDEQIERLCKLIEYQGFRNPIIAQKGTNLVVAGHGRILAAKKLGMKTVPVTYQEFENEAQLYSYIVSDNAIGKDTWATLDLGMISEEVKDLGLDDLELLGLKDFNLELPEEKVALTDEDEVPEVEIPITIKGDVWLLGNHRLMCGDSTVLTDVETLILNNRIDLIHTDPPYGIKEDASKRKTRETNSLAKSNSHLVNFNDESADCARESFVLCESLNVKNAVWWGANNYCHSLPETTSWIVWDKRVEEKQKDNNSDCELAWVKSKWSSVRIFRHLWKGLIKESERGQARIHPTQKPIALVQWVFEYFKDEPKTVLDLFGGSGSTLIACENKNKTAFVMEITEHYCDVIINRWQNYTGKQAVLESTGQTYEELKLIRSKA